MFHSAAYSALGVNYGAQLNLGPGSSSTPFLQPGGHRNIPQRWPGVTYPWVPWLPGWSGFATPPGIDPLNAATRICLGNQCWPYAQMALADADQVVASLREKSWPLAYAGLMAVALYDRGFRRQARAVLDMYGGIYGVEKVARQIERVYNGETGPSVLPTGALRRPNKKEPTMSSIIDKRRGLGQIQFRAPFGQITQPSPSTSLSPSPSRLRIPPKPAQTRLNIPRHLVRKQRPNVAPGSAANEPRQINVAPGSGVNEPPILLTRRSPTIWWL